MTATRFDFAAIEVDDLYLEDWTSYRFDSDIFTPADAFSLSIGIGTSNSQTLKSNLARLRDKLRPGAEIKFWVGYGSKRALQGTGIVDSREITNDGSGTSFSIEGRDRAALMFSAADLSLYSADDTLVDLCKRATAEWSIDVFADPSSMRELRTGEASAGASARALRKKAAELGIPGRRYSKNLVDAVAKGTLDASDLGISQSAKDRSGGGITPLEIYALKVKDARVQSGETVWDFLDRHARRLGVLMRMSPDGNLNLLALDYGQEPAYMLRRTLDAKTRGAPSSGLSQNQNNILAGGERYDTSSLYKQVVVHCRVRDPEDGPLFLNSPSPTAIKPKARPRKPTTRIARDAADDALPFERTLRVQDDNIRTADEAVRRAYRELAKSRMGARVLDYTVRGHGSDGLVFATDTVAIVQDDLVGVNGPYYVVSRSFIRDENGPRTSLKLVPLGSIVIGE
jgi:prophage tail gpP-like protein